MLTNISCPHCGKSIEVTKALVEQIGKELSEDLEVKHKEELEAVKKQVSVSIAKELSEKNNLELSDLKKQLKEKEEKVEGMRQEELKLRESKRKLEEKEKEIDLTISRKVDEEKHKVEEILVKQLQESFRLKELEKEKVIGDLRKSLEDAQRKAQQGSQQTQGEVAELDLEDSLRQAFVDDSISPVEKGVRGADIKQVVRTKIGNTCGVMLWESKRTKAWSHEWLTKLKEDLRSEKANIPIIVSTVLPEEVKEGFGFVDGVYVCSPPLAIPVATLLRHRLIEVAREKFISQNKEGTAEQLYAYVTGHEFRQNMEAVVEIYLDMRQQVTRERVAFEKIWKTREAQIDKVLQSTGSMVGSIRGLVGQSLPTVKGLELLEVGEDDSKQGTLL